MRWLPECSAAAVRRAIRETAPGLPDGPLDLRAASGGGDPLWHAGSAVLANRYVVKFAWSEPAARRLLHELTVLRALTDAATVPHLPRIAAAGTDPALLITELEPGNSLFLAAVDRETAGAQLAGYLVALHRQDTRKHVAAVVGEFPVPAGHAAEIAPWQRIEPHIPTEHRSTVRCWHAWAADTLAAPAATVLVHGDLHGDNQIWQGDRLRLVLDYDSAWLADPEYDLRALPDTATLEPAMRHYARLSGAPLSPERVLAWHLRAKLADLTWRGEAGLPLPDHRTPAAWITGLAAILPTP